MQLTRPVPSDVYPELPRVLERLVAHVQSILEQQLVGVYLVGSLAVGDFDLDSDIDFVVVTDGELSARCVAELNAAHAGIHRTGCYPAEHLEGSYLSLARLRDTAGVGIEPVWFLENGDTELQRSAHDNQWHVRWILREREFALIGRGPRDFVPPVPCGAMAAEARSTLRELQRGMRAELDGPLAFLNSRFGQSFAILTACRLLQTMRSGEVHSKRASVRWALRHLSAEWHELIEAAWVEREGVRFCQKIRQLADRDLLRRTEAFVDHAVARST